MHDVQERLQAMPGVRRVVAVDGVTRLMLQPENLSSQTGKPQPQPTQSSVAYVPAGYFETIDVPLVYGREFRSGDEPFSLLTPTIITETFAKQLFGVSNVIGRRVQTASGGTPGSELEIVGVVAGDSIDVGNGSTKVRIFIPPMSQRTFSMGKLLIRTSGLGAEMIPTLRMLAKIAAPTIPVKKMQTITQMADEQRSTVSRATSATATGGLIVLLLAAIGLYAVVALNIGQRRREIGIRVAMGARPSQVVAMFFGRGVKLSVIGLVIGLPLSTAAANAAMQRPGTPHTSIIAIAASIAVCVVAVASLASWLPARRAAHVDALIALRAD